jgi:hypothetical protein
MELYANGVQMFFQVGRSEDDLREDRRRAARQLGLFTLERECRTVQVGVRKLKAWRVPGEPEFYEHARIVARLAEEFSHVVV